MYNICTMYIFLGSTFYVTKTDMYSSERDFKWQFNFLTEMSSTLDIPNKIKSNEIELHVMCSLFFELLSF